DTALTSSSETSTYGQSVTFTALVTSSGTPLTSGAVTFQDGTAVLGMVNLDGTGHASYSTSSLTAASSPRTITAAFRDSEEFEYAPSSDSVSHTVNRAPLTITADNPSKVDGAPLPPLTVSYSGFGNGDPPASLTAPPSLYTLATPGSHVAGSPYLIGFPVGGLVSWWRGEGNAPDSFGNNPGSVNGTVSYAGGEVGQAVRFSRSGALSVPDAARLPPAPATPHAPAQPPP